MVVSSSQGSMVGRLGLRDMMASLEGYRRTEWLEDDW